VSEQGSTREIVVDKRAPCGVTFVAGERTFKGTSMHFTEKGMMMICKNPAPLNARGKITLKFSGLMEPVELSGEVVWTNIHGVGDTLSPKGMGIRFVNIEKEQEKLLSELSAQYESLGSMYACYYA